MASQTLVFPIPSPDLNSVKSWQRQESRSDRRTFRCGVQLLSSVCSLVCSLFGFSEQIVYF